MLDGLKFSDVNSRRPWMRGGMRRSCWRALTLARDDSLAGPGPSSIAAAAAAATAATTTAGFRWGARTVPAAAACATGAALFGGRCRTPSVVHTATRRQPPPPPAIAKRVAIATTTSCDSPFDKSGDNTTTTTATATQSQRKPPTSRRHHRRAKTGKTKDVGGAGGGARAKADSPAIHAPAAASASAKDNNNSDNDMEWPDGARALDGPTITATGPNERIKAGGEGNGADHRGQARSGGSADADEEEEDSNASRGRSSSAERTAPEPPPPAAAVAVPAGGPRAVKSILDIAAAEGAGSGGGTKKSSGNRTVGDGEAAAAEGAIADGDVASEFSPMRLADGRQVVRVVTDTPSAAAASALSHALGMEQRAVVRFDGGAGALKGLRTLTLAHMFMGGYQRALSFVVDVKQVAHGRSSPLDERPQSGDVSFMYRIMARARSLEPYDKQLPVAMHQARFLLDLSINVRQAWDMKGDVDEEQAYDLADTLYGALLARQAEEDADLLRQQQREEEDDDEEEAAVRAAAAVMFKMEGGVGIPDLNLDPYLDPEAARVPMFGGRGPEATAAAVVTAINKRPGGGTGGRKEQPQARRWRLQQQQQRDIGPWIIVTADLGQGPTVLTALGLLQKRLREERQRAVVETTLYRASVAAPRLNGKDGWVYVIGLGFEAPYLPVGSHAGYFRSASHTTPPRPPPPAAIAAAAGAAGRQKGTAAKSSTSSPQSSSQSSSSYQSRPSSSSLARPVDGGAQSPPPPAATGERWWRPVGGGLGWRATPAKVVAATAADAATAVATGCVGATATASADASAADR